MGSVVARTITLRSGESLGLRSSVKSDGAAIRDLHVAVAESGGLTYTEADELSRDVGRIGDVTERNAGAPGCLHVVAEPVHQGPARSLAGSIELLSGSGRRTRHTATLTLLVHPAWQRRGLGRALLSAGIEWATGTGTLSILQLTVLESNRGAISLYEQAGFLACGRWPREVRLPSGELVDTLLMVRDLGVVKVGEEGTSAGRGSGSEHEERGVARRGEVDDG